MAAARPEASAIPRRGLFIGLAAVDVVYRTAEIPRRNRKTKADDFYSCAGGPASNAAVTCAALGGAATLVSHVGQSNLGQYLREAIQAFDVELIDCAGDADWTPPIASILVDPASGDRTIVSYMKPSPKIATEVYVDMNDFAFVLWDGYYPELVERWRADLVRRGLPVVLDGGTWKDGTERIVPLLDCAICAEAFDAPGCRSHADTIHFFRAQGVARGAITRGEKAIVYWEKETMGEVSPPAVAAVDTLGAGDLFHGAFCHAAYIEGRPFREALMLGAEVAAQACRYVGPHTWIVRRTED